MTEVEGERGVVVALLPPGEAGTLLVRLDDDLTPLAHASLDGVRGAAAARLGEDLYLFSARGAYRIRERIADAGDDAAPFEVVAFLEQELDFQVDAAATVERGIVLCGRTSDGLVAVRRFDGFELLPVRGGPGEPQGVRAVAATGLDGGRFALAARSPDALWLAQGDDQGLRWSAPLTLPGDRGGVAIAGRGQSVVVFALAGDAADLHLVSVRGVGERLSSPTELAAVGAGASLVGARTTERNPGALLSIGSDLAARSAEGAEIDPPAYLAVWTAQHSRFRLPVSLHLLLFVLLGMLTRRAAPGAPAAAVEARMRRFELAPLSRRVIAFAIDVLIAGIVAAVLGTLAFGQRDLSYATMQWFGQGVIGGALHDVFYLSVWVLTALIGFVEGGCGRSLGKALLGLRVIRLDGEPVGLPGAATRALFLLVDFIQFNGLVGLVFVLFTRRRQRLGDFVAGTLVVRQARGVPQSPAPPPSA